MKRNIMRVLVIAAVLAFLLPGVASAAARALPDEGGYTITDYNVHAVISEKNVYEITETIRVNFSEPRHGIYREIPINSTETRQGSDGQTYTTKVSSSVSNVRVKGYKFSTSNEGDIFGIKIGDANKTMVGDQTYVISYKLSFGNDGVDAFDEAYYNIIGTRWDTTIDHASFTVELPKAFDKTKLGFSVGTQNTSGYDSDMLKFMVSGNTITGETLKQLRNYYGVTMRVELPQGYFNVPDLRLPDWIIMGIIAALCLISILLFLVFGIDPKPVRTVEFNAPEGMTPTDVGYIIDGQVDDRDVTALIIYWADKGYLKIEDAGEDSFKLTKLKEMPKGANDYETHMFTKLFKDGPTVETADLENTFYKTVSSVISMVKMHYTGDKGLFTKASMALKPWLGFLTILPMLMTMYLEAYRGVQIVAVAIMLGVMFGLGLLLPVFWLIHVMRTWRLHTATSRVVQLFLSLTLWVAASAYFVIQVRDNIHTQLPWVAVAGTLIIALCAVFIRKRTQQSALWYAKIMSFREFIMLAERDKLVMLVEQNPSYFYNVLPFAYVMNVTDKWAEKFESIALEPPQWYSGMNNAAFNSMMFMHSMSSSMNTLASSMTSAPSSGGSGGGGGGSSFSGGSSSGGGGGGGGGGSW